MAHHGQQLPNEASQVTLRYKQHEDDSWIEHKAICQDDEGSIVANMVAAAEESVHDYLRQETVIVLGRNKRVTGIDRRSTANYIGKASSTAIL